MSILLIVTLWYHAYDLYRYLGGYWIWLVLVSAVWDTDRILRVARIIVTGLRWAQIVDLGGPDGFVRADVPGVRWGNAPGLHAYFYFPTLHTLRPWENHPFSVLPSSLLRASKYVLETGYQSASSPGETESVTRSDDLEKRPTEARSTAVVHSGGCTTGLTLLIRKDSGMTKALQAQSRVLTLIEGPYPNNSTTQVLRCDRLLLIGGGIGITSLIPFVNHHWNVKLAWSMKEKAQCLIKELDVVLDRIVDKQIEVGTRLDIEMLLRETRNKIKRQWTEIWPQIVKVLIAEYLSSGFGGEESGSE